MAGDLLIFASTFPQAHKVAEDVLEQHITDALRWSYYNHKPHRKAVPTNKQADKTKQKIDMRINHGILTKQRYMYDVSLNQPGERRVILKNAIDQLNRSTMIWGNQ